jgi:cytochrome c oxidase subunit 3
LTLYLNVFNKGVLLNPYKFPLLNTAILLTSGAFLTVCHNYLRIEKFLRSIIFLAITIFFAFCFIGCQFYEYVHAAFSINDGIYGSLFFMLTGFHGFHVIVGTVFLLVC